MKSVFNLLLLAAIVVSCGLSPVDGTAQSTNTMKTLYDFTASTIDGTPYDFSTLMGKKVMIVNTASECGLTPQYESLEELYQEFGNSDFEIIGFPANNFAGQEPGSNEEIAAFCSKNYGVSFTMMSKISVKGADIHPIYQWLTSASENGVADYEVMWNFHKFLIDENGKLVKDIKPQTLPTDAEVIDWISQ